jgi:flagellar hook-basal body complex protein FliE
MTIAPLSVSPSAAAQAYRSVDGGAPSLGVGAGGGADFGSTLQRAIEGAVGAGKQADAQSVQAITGHANITEVVTAVSRAELALQTTATLRDKVVQAYQEIMKMPI